MPGHFASVDVLVGWGVGAGGQPRPQPEQQSVGQLPVAMFFVVVVVVVVSDRLGVFSRQTREMS